jgi:hypothetical protein
VDSLPVTDCTPIAPTLTVHFKPGGRGNREPQSGALLAAARTARAAARCTTRLSEGPPGVGPRGKAGGDQPAGTKGAKPTSDRRLTRVAAD